MSWFRKALTINPPTANSLYTVVDPSEFYEWRFTQNIPKGTIFTKKLPPSEVFTAGMLIASAEIPESRLMKQNFGYALNDNIYANIVLHVGQIQTPTEIVEKLHSLQGKFNQSLGRFQTACRDKKYITSGDRNPELYCITYLDSKFANLSNFGSIAEITNKLSAMRNSLHQLYNTKKGKAYELDLLKKYDQSLAFFQDMNLYIDPVKIDFLFHSANIKPQSDTKIDWLNCYTKMSSDANAMHRLIKQYNSLQWIQETLKHSNSNTGVIC